MADEGTPKDSEVLNRNDFDEALLAYGGRTWFVWWLFGLCFSSCILNGFHVMSYVFYSGTPDHWCRIPALENTTWTPRQIRNVSSPSPTEESNCEYYKWDYEHFKEIGYDEALKKVKADDQKPETIPCESFYYETEDEESSFVPEWDMVCDNLVMKASVQTAISLGKFSGAFTFGIFADKYGRKTTFIVSSVIYMMSAPVIAWTRLYTILLICRIGVGVAMIGIYQSGYLLLVEICPPHMRATLGVLFNQSYAVGMIMISIIAYNIRHWRQLQLIISAPTYLLIVHLLTLPESPRWAYYSGRPMYGWYIVKNYMSPEKQQMIIERRISTVVPVEEKVDMVTKLKRIAKKTMSQLAFLKHTEVSMRLALCWIIWCFTSMCYYALSITSGHLKIDSYLYTGLVGLVEGISYLLAVPMLRILGRRGTSTFLLFSTSSAFGTLLILPDNMTNAKMFSALFGRLCISSVYVAVILHASELFPTVMRNTAIGTSSAWSHVGSTIAPYLVDYFVIYGWWVPNVICGGAAFIAALFAQFLPETRDLTLYNNMEDFLEKCEANPEERISFKHFFLFKLFKKRSPVTAPQTS